MARRLQLAVSTSGLRRLLGRYTVVVRYLTPSSGTEVQLPVWAVPSGGGWIVAVAGHRRKTWWKAFRRPLVATLQVDGISHRVTGVLLAGPGREAAVQEYLRLVPRARRMIEPDTPMLRFSPDAAA